MRKLIQHHFNSMHIYSFLVKIGFNRKLALVTARKWERFVHGIIY